MLEDFTHGTLEINRGRWFINNIITLSSESRNATSGAHCIHLCYTVCVYLRCRDFLPKCFSIEKLRLQEAQYWLFFNRDLLPLLLLHLYKQIIFSYMEKLCCFCDIGSSFLRVFPKMQQNFCDSDIWIGTRKSHFRGPRFQNFQGEDTPGPPYKCEILCIHQSAQELDPPLVIMLIHVNNRQFNLLLKIKVLHFVLAWTCLLCFWKWLFN
jgi:hypothetical protein